MGGLFTNLLASRPAKQRRGVWLIAALLHLPLVLLIWFVDTSINAGQFEQAIVPILIESAPIPVDRPERRETAALREARARNSALAGVVQDAAPQAAFFEVADGRAVVIREKSETASLRERLNTAAAANAQLAGPLPARLTETATDAEMLRVAARLRPFADSLVAEEKAAAKAVDWTRTDEKGSRWGISRQLGSNDVAVHLGGVTIGLKQSQFVGSLENQAATKARLRMHTAIEQGAERAAIKEVFDQRVAAIQEDRLKKRGGLKKPPQ